MGVIMFEKVCFFVNYNQYESKRYFTEKLSQAMNRQGIKTKIFDVVESKIHERMIEEIKEFNPDFTLSFNSILPLPDNTYLWDLLKIPHLSMLLDPSIYSVSLIQSPYSIISCVDYFDCYGLATQNFDRVFFFPHGVEKELFEESKKDKEYDVVFIGSCYDYETMRLSWQRELSKDLCAVLESASETFLSEPEVSLQEALIRAWQKFNLSPEGADFVKLFTYLDRYTRGLDRVQLIKNIRTAEVHIFGEPFEDDATAVKGWKDLLKTRDNVIFHRPVSYSEGLKILQKSKICLNSSPFFKNGSHERIFNGLACGALVITNDTLFVRENFSVGEDIVTYSSNPWNDINEKVNYYLSNDEERNKVIAAGKKRVMEHDTWDHRVTLLKEVMPSMLLKTPAHK